MNDITLDILKLEMRKLKRMRRIMFFVAAVNLLMAVINIADFVMRQ